MHNSLVAQGRVCDGDGCEARSDKVFTRIVCIPEQLAVQLLWSLALCTLLDAKEHIQVLGEIQPGRKQLDQDKLSLHIKVGLLKEKSRKGLYGGQGSSLTKSASVSTNRGYESDVTTLPIKIGPLSSKITLMSWLQHPPAGQLTSWSLGSQRS